MTARSMLLAFAVSAVFGAPFVLGEYQLYLAQLVMLNIIAALGLNLLTGNCGQISLCHSSFAAIGAYVSSLLMLRSSVSFVLAVPVGVGVAAALGACLGFPARRLSGLYLALITLGFLQLVQVGIEEFPELTGGVRGLSVPKVQLLGPSLQDGRIFHFVVAAVTVASIVAAYHLQHSRFGRAFNAVRQSAYAAQALGIPLSRTKLLAFSIAAGFAGLSGALQAVVVGFIDPTEFGISTALRQITFIVVGGLGSVLGSVLGAISLTVLPELLRGTQEYSDLIYGVSLLASLLFMPHGLSGLLNRLTVRPNKAAVSRKAPAEAQT